MKNHSCIATSRPLPGSQQLPLVLQTTPLAPQVPPGSTPIDGGGILLFLDFRHFRPLAPHTRPPRTLYVRSTTDPTPKASLSPFFPFSEANSSVLVHFKIRPRGGGGSGVRTSPPRYWPVTHPGRCHGTAARLRGGRTHEECSAGSARLIIKGVQ